MMNRRKFFGRVAGGLLTAPLAARAQQPKLPLIGFLGTTSYSVQGQAEASARQLGIQSTWLQVRRIEDIGPAIAGFKCGDFLYVCNDAFLGTNSVEINNAAIAARLPTMHGLVRADEIIQ